MHGINAIKSLTQNQRKVSKAKKRTVKFAGGFLKAVFLTGFCFVILYPIFTMISKAFMGRMDIFDNTVILIPKNITLQNFEIAIMLTDFWNALRNTVALSLLTMILQTASSLSLIHI